MRRLTGFLLVVLLLVPAVGAHALSCMPPRYREAQDLVANRLDGYNLPDTPEFDLLLVGTLVHRSDLHDSESGFGHRVLTVVVAGAFGHRIESALMQIEGTTWRDPSNVAGGPESRPVAIPLWLNEDGVYHAGVCTVGFEIADPYVFADELAAIAEHAGVSYQLFPPTDLEDVTTKSSTTYSSVSTDKSNSAPQATPTTDSLPAEGLLDGRSDAIWILLAAGAIVGILGRLSWPAALRNRHAPSSGRDELGGSSGG